MSNEVEQFWKVMAPTYDSVVDETIGERLRPAVADRISSEGRLGMVAEFGCGTGYFTEALARQAEEVMATDLSKDMLARAGERLRDLKNVTLSNEDCMKTSLPGEAFDTVFMALVLNLVPEPARALDEAWRILRPGGTLLIANPDWGFLDMDTLVKSGQRLLLNYRKAVEDHPLPGENMGEDRLKKLVEDAGFRIASMELIRDVSDSSNCTMEYLRAVKSRDLPAGSTASRFITEIAGDRIVISVKSLVKNYGQVTAVCNVTFRVRRGEIFALLGPNGAGKTTIVEILECLKSPTRGYINILGDDVLLGDPMGNVMMGSDMSYQCIKEKIGVLPQSFSAFDLLTVAENIDYFGRMYPKRVDTNELMREISLWEKRNSLFKNLSGGLKQRVGIALALVNDPEIVFLDEPSAGLDPRSRRDLWAAIHRLKARGKTVFLTTHYMDEAYQLADRIAVIHRGSIVAEGTPDDLIQRFGGPSTLVVRGLNARGRDHLLHAFPEGHANGDELLVALSPDDGVASISRAAALISSNSLSCKEIYVQRPTLDDVFLHLTGEQLVEGGD